MQDSNKYQELSRAVDSRKSSHRYLSMLLKKEFQTTFIGEIARVEQYFGRYWGLGLPESQCTENQLRVRRIWEECRNEMLNHGNNRERNVQRILDEFFSINK